jgi:type I restriction enzyme M protein
MVQVYFLEFKKYRESNKLWYTNMKEISYQISKDKIGRVRILEGVVSEPEVFYGKNN